MKMKENDATGRKRSKMEKKPKNIPQKRKLCSFYQRTPLTRLDRPEKIILFLTGNSGPGRAGTHSPDSDRHPIYRWLSF